MKSHLVPKKHPNQIHVIYKKSYEIPFIGGFIPSIGGFLPPFAFDSSRIRSSIAETLAWRTKKRELCKFQPLFLVEFYEALWSFTRFYRGLYNFIKFYRVLKFMELFDDMRLN